MDKRMCLSIKVQQKAVRPTITAALASAILEWFLIFLLFIDASFSYFITKFAHHCHLQIPCMLCSRLDHVLGKEKSGFYWDLICRNHKKKISSLVLCHHHDNLIDVHGMCESCLFSFATANKKSAVSYNFLVGKLGKEPQFELDQDPLLTDDNLSSANKIKCLCCNEQYICGVGIPLLLRTKSIRDEDLDAPLLSTDQYDTYEVFEIKDVSSQLARSSSSGKIDPLSHVEYEKVKLTSDTESEASFSGNDSASNSIQEARYCKQDVATDYEGEDKATDNLASKTLADPELVPEPTIMDPEICMEAGDLNCIASPASTGHGLEGLNWQHVEHKADTSAPCDFFPFSDPIPSSNAKPSVSESTEILDVEAAAQMPKDAAEDSDELDELASNVNSAKEKQSDLRSTTVDISLQIPNALELGDAYKLAVGSKGRQLSGKLLEQKSLKDSGRLNEDLKLLLSQLSAARSIELPLNDMSPKISGNIDESRPAEASSSIGMQILQRRISLERNESGISLDGSTVSEIEGEGVMDRLRRQVEHDRKLMGVLYKELEEERNASAIAANQALAMITRLQEEKASFQMEALQCLRMMEEQSEYDGEALQKANDLVAVKETQIHDLECQLELCKKRFGGVSHIESLVELDSDMNIREIIVKQLEASSEQRDSSACKRGHIMPSTSGKIDDNENSSLDGDRSNKLPEFEDEALYILECLNKLEAKLELFSNNEAIVDWTDGYLSIEENVTVIEEKKTSYGQAAPENDEINVDHLEYASIQNESHSALERSTFQYEDPRPASKGNGQLKPGKYFHSDVGLDSLKNDFLVLRGRIDALKSAQRFLENSMSSLSKGNEGLKFIKEIASQVRELHSLGIKK